jgi:hypothetical protein
MIGTGSIQKLHAMNEIWANAMHSQTPGSPVDGSVHISVQTASENNKP